MIIDEPAMLCQDRARPFYFPLLASGTTLTARLLQLLRLYFTVGPLAERFGDWEDWVSISE